MFEIRPATASDLPQVIALIRALAEFERLPGPDDAAAARLCADAVATPPRFELLVAEEAGELVAYAMFFPIYSSFLARSSLYLEDLFVHPRVRGRGIGAALMRRLAALAAARGCGRFEWTVLDWNVRALAFYRTLGAQVLSQWCLCRVDGDALARLAAADRD
jgi:GNAT superfamily N-acetyltransferase